MRIRPARPGDAEAIAAIWNAVIDDTAITFTTERKTEQGLAADIATRGAGFQVACDAGAVVGFATYFPFRAGPGYAHTKEHSIQLAPAARGRGTGRALMAALEAAARAQGVHSLWAGVSGENPDGVSFHAALGFAEIARLPQVGYKFGRWMDLVLMQKMLNGSR
jgi:phosphinothricin acetyltransferase